MLLMRDNSHIRQADITHLSWLQRSSGRSWTTYVATTVAGSRSQAGRAAVLCGAAEALRDAIGTPLPSSERAGYERMRSGVSAVLGAEGFAGACATGRALRLEEAIALALDARSSG
jgi:hypothetical protein